MEHLWIKSGLRLIFDSERDAKCASDRWILRDPKRGNKPKVSLLKQLDPFGNAIDKYYLDIQADKVVVEKKGKRKKKPKQDQSEQNNDDVNEENNETVEVELDV